MFSPKKKFLYLIGRLLDVRCQLVSGTTDKRNILYPTADSKVEPRCLSIQQLYEYTNRVDYHPVGLGQTSTIVDPSPSRLESTTRYHPYIAPVTHA